MITVDAKYNWLVIILGFLCLSFVGFTWVLMNGRVQVLEEWRKSAQPAIEANCRGKDHRHG